MTRLLKLPRVVGALRAVVGCTLIGLCLPALADQAVELKGGAGGAASTASAPSAAVAPPRCS